MELAGLGAVGSLAAGSVGIAAVALVVSEKAGGAAMLVGVVASILGFFLGLGAYSAGRRLGLLGVALNLAVGVAVVRVISGIR